MFSSYKDKNILESLKYYKEDGYEPINNLLRKVKNSNSILNRLKDTEYSEEEKHIKNIDKIFEEKEYSYSEYDKPLYRGFSPYFDIEKINNSDEYGYVSSSKDINVAEKFSDRNCCILKFYLPKTIKSIEILKTGIMDELSTDLSTEIRDTEGEVLLERNIQFTNIKKIGTHSGFKDVDLYAATVQKLSQLTAEDVLKYEKMKKQEEEKQKAQNFQKELEKRRAEQLKMLEISDDDFDD